MRITLLFIMVFFCVKSKSQPQAYDSTQKLHSFLKEWWNVPYSWGGTTKRGVDCSAFVREMYEELHNKKLPRTSREQYKYVQKIKVEDLKTGDLVFFKRSDGIWHVGYYLFDSLFAHSSSKSKGVNIDNLYDPYYKKNWFSQGRVR